MSLLVIGSGFGRTGTMSLKNALETLGFGPCHHMEEVFAHPPQVAHWAAAARGEPVDWHAVFAGYRSQVDWPGAAWWRDLADAFPDAKVIHTERPAEAWYDSFAATIGKLMAIRKDLPLPPHIAQMLDIGTDVVAGHTFGGRPDDRDHAIAVYRQHGAAVRAAIPARRLLVFDPIEGWGPLCRFLGVAVPSAPFPHRNRGAEFWDMLKPPG